MNAQLNRSFPGTMFVLAGVAALGVSTSTNADSLDIFGDMANSTEGIADFVGTLTWDFVLGDLGVLTIDLTNTTVFPTGADDHDDDDKGGFLTGFIFNIGSSDEGASAVLTSTTNKDFEDAQNQNGGPFGNPFVGGASLGGMWLDGGMPDDGLGIGESGTFTFDVTASDAEFLSAGSFLQGPYDFNFIVRFRGLGKGGEFSDMTPAIPAPGVLALLGLGALAQRRRRRTA